MVNSVLLSDNVGGAINVFLLVITLFSGLAALLIFLLVRKRINTRIGKVITIGLLFFTFLALALLLFLK